MFGMRGKVQSNMGSFIALFALLLVACEEGPTYQSLAYRFQDDAPTGPEPSSSRPPEGAPGYPTHASRSAVVLGGETRYVLPGYREYPLFSLADSEIPDPADGFVRLAFELPAPLLDRQDVFIRLRVMPTGKEVSWIEIPAHITRIEPGGQLYLKFPVTGEKPRKLNIFARPLSESKQHSDGPFEVPKDATLEFGFGIEPVGWRPGAPPVTFRVFATAKRGADESRLLFESRLDPAHKETDRQWMDARIDLGELAGRNVVFTFESVIESEGPAATYPLWSNPRVYSTRRRPKNALNFILISLDTLRARNLGTYGYPLNTSPFLDELADREAIVFEKAFTTAATTRPSHMSMFTGLLPSVHDLTTGLIPLSKKLVTLPEILWEAGYETQAVTEDAWVAGYWGFSRGMNSYRENLSAELSRSTGQVDIMVDQALEWLEQNSNKKFFLFLHTYQVHNPYKPPAAYQNLFVPYVYDGKTYENEEELPNHLRQMRDYDREIRYTDDELRRLFKGFRELGLDRTTVVLITSDHGEEFLEHGYLLHSAHLYEEILRVPLIVWGPAVIGRPRRIPVQVSIVDLMPTILDLADLPIPKGLQGISLASAIRDEGVLTQTPDRAVFGEAWGLYALGAEGRWIPWNRPTLTVRNARYKYIMKDVHNPKGPQFELYDLLVDPMERNDIATIEPDPWLAGREMLLAYGKTSAARRRELLSTGREQEPQKPIAIDSEREEKLKALGYVQ